jgi:hypothetical protein
VPALVNAFVTDHAVSLLMRSTPIQRVEGASIEHSQFAKNTRDFGPFIASAGVDGGMAGAKRWHREES